MRVSSRQERRGENCPTHPGTAHPQNSAPRPAPTRTDPGELHQSSTPDLPDFDTLIHQRSAP